MEMPHRSNGVEIVAKGGRSCLHVAQMKEGDFGGIFIFTTEQSSAFSDQSISINISINISISINININININISQMLSSGQYTCEASNTLGSSKDSIIVVGQ